MIRVQNFSNIGQEEISRLSRYITSPPDHAISSNPRKHQYVYETTVKGEPAIVKLYFHRALKHRLASFLGHGNADRYSSMAKFLLAAGLPVPAPLLLLKTGRGLLPEQSLYAMKRVEGEMLFSMLTKLQTDTERISILAKKISDLISRLKSIGVIHRDLNTKNFLVAENNEVTLIDFDAASRFRSRNRNFEERHQRDIDTFLATCQNAPLLAASIQTLVRNR